MFFLVYITYRTYINYDLYISWVISQSLKTMQTHEKQSNDQKQYFLKRSRCLWNQCFWLLKYPVFNCDLHNSWIISLSLKTPWGELNAEHPLVFSSCKCPVFNSSLPPFLLGQWGYPTVHCATPVWYTGCDARLLVTQYSPTFF